MRNVNHIEDGVGIVILSQRQIVVESAAANNDVILKIIKKIRYLKMNGDWGMTPMRLRREVIE